MRGILCVIMLILAAGLAMPAMAQTDSSRVNVFGGYSFLRACDQGSCVNFNGGSGQLAYNLSHRFAAVGDFGVYKNSTGGVSATLFSYTFGPRVSFGNDKFTPFVQTLFGGARASALGVSANAFAMALGGGVDYKLSPHFAIRPVQAEYVLTKFNDGANNRQNNFRYSAGVVFLF